MSYNMKKMHIENWKDIFNRCKKNRRKIIFNPFYSKKQFISELYKKQLDKELNFNSPTGFNEKQNLLKLNDSAMQDYHKYADKYLVRDYVAKKIGKKYLVPTYFYTKKLKVSDLEKLPNGFVLKATNGSGTNYIVEDKSKEDLQAVVKYLNWLSKLKYGYLWGEFYYNKIKPGIIAEKLLLDKKGNIPDDLKCYCFKDNSGERRKVLYVERVIGDERRRIMFNEKWQPVDYGGGFGKLDAKVKKPSNYQEILHIIDKLSEDFNFVRVDLFILKDKVYFGELTFVPTAGYMQLNDEETNQLWGSWIGDY